MKKKYITDSNNETHSKINDIKIQLFDVSPDINKKNVIVLEKVYLIFQK